MNTLEENFKLLHDAREVETDPERIKYLDITLELIGQQGGERRRAGLAV